MTWHAPNVRPADSSAKPDHAVYADTGCDAHPSCLSCPFVRCRYDEPHGIATARRKQVAAEANRLRAQGMTAVQAAEALGVSRRTVVRARAS